MPVAASVTIQKRTRRRGEIRKQEIVDAVLTLATERDLEGLSTQEIADFVGISQGALFRHFPTKESIWTTLLDRLQERLNEFIITAETWPNDRPLETLSRIFDAHTEFISHHPAMAKLIFSDHLRRLHPVLDEKFQIINDAYKRRLVALVRSAQKQGLVRDAIDPPAAASLFLCMVQGLAFQFAIASTIRSMRREARSVFSIYQAGLTREQLESVRTGK
jgi:TetR/AcrR family transcriptional regulator